MQGGPRPATAQMEGLIAALDDALDMLGEFSVSTELVPVAGSPESLLDQCLELCEQAEATGPEPIRTLHHFACTGGTLISKCLAAMPNTQVLSEVDPLSTFLEIPGGPPRFVPTDMISLLRQASRSPNTDLLIEVFLAELGLVHVETLRMGQRLLLRDHAHGHYCHGPNIPRRLGLRDIVDMRFPIMSVITVRHPLDSYLALSANGWISYTPPGFDEYCRRYLVFLADHAGLPVVRYEDFVDAPQAEMQALCHLLALPYADDFVHVFDAFRLTGDSGRTGNAIERRPRRRVDDDTAAEAATSPHYPLLLQRLHYDE